MKMHRHNKQRNGCNTTPSDDSNCDVQLKSHVMTKLSCDDKTMYSINTFVNR